jgi:hypothetical protein
MAHTDVVRALRDSLEELLAAIEKFSTEGEGGARRLSGEFVPLGDGAFHQADDARAAAWTCCIEPYFEVVRRGDQVFPEGARPKANMRAAPGAEAEQAELREGPGGADPVMWSTLTTLRGFFGSIDHQQPFAGQWRFNPLKPETMIVDAQALSSLGMAIKALESLVGQVGPVMDDWTALRLLSGREQWGVDELPSGIGAEVLASLDQSGLVQTRITQMIRSGPTRSGPVEASPGEWFSPAKSPEMVGDWRDVLKQRVRDERNHPAEVRVSEAGRVALHRHNHPPQKTTPSQLPSPPAITSAAEEQVILGQVAKVVRAFPQGARAAAARLAHAISDKGHIDLRIEEHLKLYPDDGKRLGKKALRERAGVSADRFAKDQADIRPFWYLGNQLVRTLLNDDGRLPSRLTEKQAWDRAILAWALLDEGANLRSLGLGTIVEWRRSDGWGRTSAADELENPEHRKLFFEKVAAAVARIQSDADSPTDAKQRSEAADLDRRELRETSNERADVLSAYRAAVQQPGAARLIRKHVARWAAMKRAWSQERRTYDAIVDKAYKQLDRGGKARALPPEPRAYWLEEPDTEVWKSMSANDRTAVAVGQLTGFCAVARDRFAVKILPPGKKGLVLRVGSVPLKVFEAKVYLEILRTALSRDGADQWPVEKGRETPPDQPAPEELHVAILRYVTGRGVAIARSEIQAKFSNVGRNQVYQAIAELHEWAFLNAPPRSRRRIAVLGDGRSWLEKYEASQKR